MSAVRGREHRVLRMVRSTTSLIIIAAALGFALAAALGATAWVIADTLKHASNA